MAKNVPGAKFFDKKGNPFVLGKDPKGGHLRPFAEGKQPQGCGTAALILVVIMLLAAVAVAALL